MGTQGSITVYDEQGKDIANIVTQYDGYDLYEWVERFLSGKKITNGISNDYDFNGMSDLAARLIAALKTQRYKSDIGQPVKPGNVYLYSSPYQTDYHIDIRFGGEGQKPRMSVEQGDDWYDPHYHETQLPPLGEANVRMQGAESFNAESEVMVHQIIVPYEPGGYATTYIYRDEKDLKKALWGFAQSRMWEEGEDYPEYDWDGSFDSAENKAIWDKKTKKMSVKKIMEYGMIDHDHYYEKIALNLDGFRIDGEYGGVENMTLKDGVLMAETFNSYKVAPELSSYTKEELIDSKAGPQGTDTYDEMEYDPIAQDRLSAEECSKCVVDRELSGLGKGSSIGFHTSSRSACPSWCINAQDRQSAESFASDEDEPLFPGLICSHCGSDKYTYYGEPETYTPDGKPIDPNWIEAKEHIWCEGCGEASPLDEEFGAESFASDEYRLCEICESTHHESEFGNSDDEEQTMTPKGKVCDSCFGDILFDDFQNADERDWAKEYLESKGFQQHPIEGSFEDRFASETTSTLKSIGYVAGTVGVGYLLFQRFLKDRLDKTMNPDS